MAHLPPKLVQAIQERARQDKKRAYERIQASGLEPTETLMNAMMLHSMAEALGDFLPDVLGGEDHLLCGERKSVGRWWQFWKRRSESGNRKPRRQ